MRPHLKMSGASYRLDETYVKVGKEWKYLYRAVDSTGDTIEFMLSAKRDVSAAKRFFKKLMRADHRRLPFTIGTDKHASYPQAFAASVREKVLPADCKLRRVKYLNNVIEQDHRFVRRRWRAMQCFRSFHTAERTIEGVEAVHMMRKGQVKRLDGKDKIGQARFVETLFVVTAWQKVSRSIRVLQSNVCNTTPASVAEGEVVLAGAQGRNPRLPARGLNSRRRHARSAGTTRRSGSTCSPPSAII